jgi:ankyrin repeat protein
MMTDIWRGVVVLLMTGTLAVIPAIGNSEPGQTTGGPPRFPSEPVAAEDESPAMRLLRSAMLGNVAEIQRALAENVDINSTSDAGSTALAVAAIHGHLPAVAALLAAGADFSLADKTGATALIAAASQGHTAIVEALVAKGASVKAIDGAGVTAVMAAASANKVEALRFLATHGADVNTADKQGTTALMAAAYAGHVNAVKALVESGAAVNIKDQNGRTALHAAALGGETQVARVLLDRGADLNAEDSAGSTALTYAAANGHGEFVTLVQSAGLKKGADLGLALAARGCHSDTVAALLKAKANIDARLQGTPAISLAAQAGCESSLRDLLAGGANVNAVDEEGTTALMEAAGLGLTPIVQLLIDRGADPEIRNKANQNAWLRAALGNHQEVIEILRKIRDQK